MSHYYEPSDTNYIAAERDFDKSPRAAALLAALGHDAYERVREERIEALAEQYAQEAQARAIEDAEEAEADSRLMDREDDIRDYRGDGT